MIYLMTAFFLSFNKASMFWWCAFGVVAFVDFTLWHFESKVEL